MEIFTTKSGLTNYLDNLKKNHRKVGFVATMGALHEGHLELVRLSREKCDITVCSIFVNPTQFNNADDLKNYPRPVEEDTRKLVGANCDVLFLPAYEEMYGEDEAWHIDLGNLEHILEGEFRPGHYQGVTQIVYKLFTVVKPDLAFFGQKDFQQLKVIARMTALLQLPVKLVMCPIVRETDGLAMSSRNVRLSPEEHLQALALSRALNIVTGGFGLRPLSALRDEAIAFLKASEGLKLEYFEICNDETLLPATVSGNGNLVALVAAWVGKTRLIDNELLAISYQ